MAASSSSGDDRENRLVPALINALVAGMADPNRLSRGRTVARQGAVDDVDVSAGVLTASVQGSRAQPYEVSVRVRRADEFDSLIKLVPDRSDVSFLCSCPDWDDPCKHAVAVMITFAALVADDPDLLRRWRGHERPEPTGRAVVGSRTGSITSAPPPSVGAPDPVLDDAAAAALRAYLGEPRQWDPNRIAVSRLAPPNAAWGELWAEMLADALDTLTDEVD